MVLKRRMNVGWGLEYLLWYRWNKGWKHIGSIWTHYDNIFLLLILKIYTVFIGKLSMPERCIHQDPCLLSSCWKDRAARRGFTLPRLVEAPRQIMIIADHATNPSSRSYIIIQPRSRKKKKVTVRNTCYMSSTKKLKVKISVRQDMTAMSWMCISNACRFTKSYKWWQRCNSNIFNHIEL